MDGVTFLSLIAVFSRLSVFLQPSSSPCPLSLSSLSSSNSQPFNFTLELQTGATRELTMKLCELLRHFNPEVASLKLMK